MKKNIICQLFLMCSIFSSCIEKKQKSDLPSGSYTIESVSFQKDVPIEEQVNFINDYQYFTINENKITFSDGQEIVYSRKDDIISTFIDGDEISFNIQTLPDEGSYELFVDNNYIKSLRIGFLKKDKTTNL